MGHEKSRCVATGKCAVPGTARPVRQGFLSEIVGQFVERRKAMGLSQEDVDGRLGTAERLCSKWECGQRTPTAFNFFCWAEALEARLVLVPGPGPRTSDSPNVGNLERKECRCRQGPTS